MKQAESLLDMFLVTYISTHDPLVLDRLKHHLAEVHTEFLASEPLLKSRLTKTAFTISMIKFIFIIFHSVITYSQFICCSDINNAMINNNNILEIFHIINILIIKYEP
jgi:hypothetical protein